MDLFKKFRKSAQEDVTVVLTKNWEANKKIAGIFDAADHAGSEKGFHLTVSPLTAGDNLVKRSIQVFDERANEIVAPLTVTASLNTKGEYQLAMIAPDGAAHPTLGPNECFAQIQSILADISKTTGVDWNAKIQRQQQSRRADPLPKPA